MELIPYLRMAAQKKGPSGHEGEVAQWLRTLFEPLCDEVKIDRMYNVIAHKRGTGAPSGKRTRIMLAAHQDEIALMATEILKDGTLRIGSVGGVDPRILPASRVTVHGKKKLLGVVGATPPHLLSAEDGKRNYRREELYVDIGLPAEEVKKLVNIGDLITLDGPLTELKNGRVACKTLDDRACVGILLEMAQRMQHITHEADIYYVCTTQEEVGGYGCITSAYGVNPDLGIAIDVTHATIPGSDPDTTVPLDAPAITFGPFVQHKLVDALTACAKENGVKYNMEHAARNTWTDADELQITRAGVPTVLLDLPLRYMHTTVETIDTHALTECARLLAAFCGGIREGWDKDLWN